MFSTVKSQKLSTSPVNPNPPPSHGATPATATLNKPPPVIIPLHRESKSFTLKSFQIDKIKHCHGSSGDVLPHCYSQVYEGMNKEIMDAISAMIDWTQAGEQIDQSVALNTVDLYLELKECARKIKAKEEKMNRGPDVLSKKINLISSDLIKDKTPKEIVQF
ncbi:SKP1 protein [Trifolium repens]|nr:SKP1 protein [Trifolium repens]